MWEKQVTGLRPRHTLSLSGDLLSPAWVKQPSLTLSLPGNNICFLGSLWPSGCPCPMLCPLRKGSEQPPGLRPVPAAWSACPEGSRLLHTSGALACASPSAWNVLPPETHMTVSCVPSGLHSNSIPSTLPVLTSLLNTAAPVTLKLLCLSSQRSPDLTSDLFLYVISPHQKTSSARAGTAKLSAVSPTPAEAPRTQGPSVIPE